MSDQYGGRDANPEIQHEGEKDNTSDHKVSYSESQLEPSMHQPSSAIKSFPESEAGIPASPTGGQLSVERRPNDGSYPYALGGKNSIEEDERKQPHVEWQRDDASGASLQEQIASQDPENVSTMSSSGEHAKILAMGQESGDAPFSTQSVDPQPSVKLMEGKVPQRNGLAMLGVFDRTNSFPDVPPGPYSESRSCMQSASEAADVIDEDQGYSGAVFDRRPYPFSHGSTNDIPEDPFGESQNYKGDDLYAQLETMQLGNVNTPPDEEARFEEGLPLVPSESQISGNASDNSDSRARSKIVKNASENEVSNDPESPSTQENLFRPQPLDRKTTNQVLDSLHYAPQSKTHDTPESAEDARSTSGEVAGSSSNIISQAFEEEQATQLNTEAKDEDLAAVWQAALDDDELLEEETPNDPSKLFDDGGEDFLSDGKGGLQAELIPSSPFLLESNPGERELRATASTDIPTHSRQLSESKYSPAPLAYPQVQNFQSHVSKQSSSDQRQAFPPAPNSFSGSMSAPGGFGGSIQQPAYRHLSNSRPQIHTSTQSFADKSKGGYTSPYDLPVDVTRPKKRNYTQQLRPGTSSSADTSRPPPPPRSSSMFNSGSPVVEAYPSMPSGLSATRSVQPAQTPATAPKHSGGAGGFFEDLPTIRTRPSSQVTKPSLPGQQISSPLQGPLGPPSQSQASFQPSKALNPSPREQTYGLIPPERASLYGSVPHQKPGGPPYPAVNSRYSPAPTSQTNVPPPRMRYAASPSGGSRIPLSQDRPFQPRTSSPLAQNEARPQQQPPSIMPNSTTLIQDMQPPLRDEVSEQPEHNATIDSSVGPKTSQASQPSPSTLPSRYAPVNNSSMPAYSINNSESDQPPVMNLWFETQPQKHQDLVPPRRSQTQSPGAIRSHHPPTGSQDLYQRPASVNDQAAPQQTILPTISRTYQSSLRSKGLSQSLEYIKPTDGREHDSLERWKGCPIVQFGFGGTLVTTFPKHIPRYASGRSEPLMKCSPGEVKIKSAKSLALHDNIWNFPGPLRSKNKKKDVLDWLQQRIVQFEEKYAQLGTSPVLRDPRTRQREKILLWRIIQVLVEHDGVLEGKADADKSVRAILSPSMAEGETDGLPPSSDARLLGISRSAGSSNLSDRSDPQDLEALRRILLEGEREKAVWHALDRRMWAHAMLISSTMDRVVWKQVLQEFIRQEVKSFGENTESLAALYQIFAGNWEESVDELVPPSARAGLQLISKAAGPGPTRNALEGLDRWRETLTLALSNRSQDDGKALIALGRLLSGYGRVEAAHICFIFAKSSRGFGGSDDPAVNFTLLGADHLQYPYDFNRDLDSILLTEVYDFACSVLTPTGTAITSPHLQAYKLYHALLLAEDGHRLEAQQYCEVITSTLKSTTKRSLYYHDLLFETLEDLVNRLRQAPSEGSSSWMSKPSLDRVSGSFFSKVNQFIAGDDSDADSAASGKGANYAAGPFASVSGDTPILSRSSSSTDLHGSHPTAPPLHLGTATASRYAPGGQYAPQGQYTPRSSLENNGGPSMEFGRPSQHDSLRATGPLPYSLPNLSRPSSSGNTYHQPPQTRTRAVQQPQGYAPRSGSYLPTPPSHPKLMPEAPPQELSTSLYESQAYRETPPLEAEPPQNIFEPYQATPTETSHAYSPPSHQSQPSDYQHPNSSYAPTVTVNEPSNYNLDHATTGYEPPSISTHLDSQYAPDSSNTQADEESPIYERSRKDSYMDSDGDDDFAARAAAVRKREQAQKDREADDAFRKAAEADGACSFRSSFLLNQSLMFP